MASIEAGRRGVECKRYDPAAFFEIGREADRAKRAAGRRERNARRRTRRFGR